MMTMTATKGNFFDSRIGGHSYAMWTTGYDVRITDGEKEYFYHLETYDGDEVRQISPIEIRDAVEVQWENLNESIRKKHFRTMYPNGTEEELNLFVYGEVEGGKLNAENEWVKSHMVFSRDVTLRLKEELGDFETVQFLRSNSRWVGTGYRDYLYLIDGKWLVTVNANCHRGEDFYDGYEIEDYSKVVAKQKAFGRRVARLAKKAGVPWEIGVFVGHIENDKDAVSLLSQIKSARGTADEHLQWELSCGIGRRVRAIENLIGIETFERLNCSGQKQTGTLASYLLGE